MGAFTTTTAPVAPHFSTDRLRCSYSSLWKHMHFFFNSKDLRRGAQCLRLCLIYPTHPQAFFAELLYAPPPTLLKASQAPPWGR